MDDKPSWRVVRLDEMERRGRDIPVREHLRIHAFGINAYTPGDDGTLIGEHDEAGSGQEARGSSSSLHEMWVRRCGS